MGKAFDDPDGARKDALKAIEDAEASKTRLVDKLVPASERVDEAKKALDAKAADVAAAIEKATKTQRARLEKATVRKAEIEYDIAEQDSIISRARAFLVATDTLATAPVVEDEPANV